MKPPRNDNEVSWEEPDPVAIKNCLTMSVFMGALRLLKAEDPRVNIVLTSIEMRPIYYARRYGYHFESVCAPP